MPTRLERATAASRINFERLHVEPWTQSPTVVGQRDVAISLLKSGPAGEPPPIGSRGNHARDDIREVIVAAGWMIKAIATTAVGPPLKCGKLPIKFLVVQQLDIAGSNLSQQFEIQPGLGVFTLPDEDAVVLKGIPDKFRPIFTTGRAGASTTLGPGLPPRCHAAVAITYCTSQIMLERATASFGNCPDDTDHMARNGRAMSVLQTLSSTTNPAQPRNAQ